MSDLDVLRNKPEFGQHEERAIIALAFEMPEFFETINQYIKLEYFHNQHVKFVYSLIDQYFKEYGMVPGRVVVRDSALRYLTVDDDYQGVLEAIDYHINPRDLPVIKGELLKWAKDKAYFRIFSEEVQQAYEDGNYIRIEEILEEARKVTDFGTIAYNFFNRYEELFIKENIEHFTTGFPSLDRHLHDGGPARSEVLCFMAPTGVGKSIAMINMAVANILRNKKVLHVTCEMSDSSTASRYAGCFTDLNINKIHDKEEIPKFRKHLERLRGSYSDSLYIQEYGPNEVSASHISALLDNLRSHKQFVPDMIVVDYMDLIQSRVSAKNMSGDDYSKHKSVSEELRALAFKSNTLVVTATQTNRSGVSGDQDVPLDVDKVAESYGKTMALDYMVSLQQSKSEYNQAIPDLRLYISKNRNGPKFKTVNAQVKYVSSKMLETESNNI